MSKKNIFLSAALSTFILVILVNLAVAYARADQLTAYQAVTPVEPTVEQPTPTLQPTPTAIPPTPTETQPVQVTYQQAADIAANFMGEKDLYSIENVVWNGVESFKVVFSSGNIVYIGLDGQVLGSEAPKTQYVSVPAASSPTHHSSSGQTGSHTDDHEDENEENDD